MNINICLIPHKDQRYPTCGDWVFVKDAPDDKHEHERLEIRVSFLGNDDMEFLIGIHEAIEAYLCHKHGIKQEDVDAFDGEFEEDREHDLDAIHAAADLVGWAEYDADKECKRLMAQEPGDHPAAPYHREHQFASKIERLIAEELGVDWLAYEKRMSEL